MSREECVAYLSCAVTRLGELPMVMAYEKDFVQCWLGSVGLVRMGIGIGEILGGECCLVRTRHAHDDDPGKRRCGNGLCEAAEGCNCTGLV